MDYDVFISYSRQDGNEYAARLQEELEAAGYKVWRDTRNINPAQDFTAEIEMGIKNSRIVAVCVTPDLERPTSFVRREIQYADVVKKPAFPCRVMDAPPPISIINREWLEFHKGWSVAFARLCQLAHDPNLQQDPGEYEKPPEDPFRDYLQALYQQIVDYLSRAVIRLIDLESAETPDAVPRKRTDDILLEFFNAAGLSTAETIEAGHRYDSFAQAFEQHQGRLLLLGEPGAGKTITLMSYARDAVAARLDDPRKPLPALKTVATWPSNPPMPITEWAAEKLDELKPEIDAGRALLLLDGLDELGSSRPIDPEKPEEGTYDPRQRFIDGVEQMPLRNQVLVTCRVNDYAAIGQQIPLEGAITLQPLSDELLRGYLSDHPRIYDAIQADDNLRDLARTPLLLSLIAFAWNDLDSDLQSKGDLRSGDVRDAIFAAYIRQRYAHEARKKNTHLSFTLNKMLETLGHAAMINASGGIRSDWRNRDIVKNVLVYSDFTYHLVDDEIDSFCTLACDLHILYRRENETYGFLHLLLRDHQAYVYSMKHLQNANYSPKNWWYPSPAKALGGVGDIRAVESLISVLADVRPGVRESAAGALGALGDARAVAPLINALADVDPEVRRLAAEALGILRDARTIEPLIRISTDAEWKVRRTAARALGQLGEHALQPLLQAIRHENPEVRGLAAGALGHLGDARAIEPLINALNDPEREVRQSAAGALGHLGDARAIEPLINALNDPEREVRQSVIDVLGQLGDARVAEPLVNALASAGWGEYHSATIALRRLGKPAFQPLLNALRHDNIDVRVLAAQILGEFEAADAAEPLIDALGDPDIRVSQAAFNALLRLGEQALSPLLNALTHKNTHVRTLAIRILEELRDVRAVEPLIDALVDKHFEVRESAAYALGQFCDTRAVEPLINTLADMDSEVRYAAAEALGILGNVRAVPVLIERLADTKKAGWRRVCDAAAKGLREIGTPEALAAVKEWEYTSSITDLSLKDPGLRSSAARALGKFGDVRAVPALIERLEDTEKAGRWRVCDMAARALKLIGTPEALAAVKEWERNGRGQR